MISRIVAAYLFGLFMAVSMVGISKGAPEGGSQLNITSEVSDDFKSDQVIEVLKGVGQLIVKVCSSIFGYSDKDAKCCYDYENNKIENGATWTNSTTGAKCMCNAGDIVCAIDKITPPTTTVA